MENYPGFNKLPTENAYENVNVNKVSFIDKLKKVIYSPLATITFILLIIDTVLSFTLICLFFILKISITNLFLSIIFLPVVQLFYIFNYIKARKDKENISKVIKFNKKINIVHIIKFVITVAAMIVLARLYYPLMTELFYEEIFKNANSFVLVMLVLLYAMFYYFTYGIFILMLFIVLNYIIINTLYLVPLIKINNKLLVSVENNKNEVKDYIFSAVMMFVYSSLYMFIITLLNQISFIVKTIQDYLSENSNIVFISENHLNILTVILIALLSVKAATFIFAGINMLRLKNNKT
jgi:hypothetical protein